MLQGGLTGEPGPSRCARLGHQLRRDGETRRTDGTPAGDHICLFCNTRFFVELPGERRVVRLKTRGVGEAGTLFPDEEMVHTKWGEDSRKRLAA